MGQTNMHRPDFVEFTEYPDREFATLEIGQRIQRKMRTPPFEGEWTEDLDTFTLFVHSGDIQFLQALRSAVTEAIIAASVVPTSMAASVAAPGNGSEREPEDE